VPSWVHLVNHPRRKTLLAQLYHIIFSLLFILKPYKKNSAKLYYSDFACLICVGGRFSTLRVL